MGKIKLSIDDQIEDMKRKGISFTLCPETEARENSLKIIHIISN